LTERFRWGSRSDVGQVRQVNQDSLLVTDGVFAVADGMGGYQGGEVASAITVAALERAWPGADLDTVLRGVALANEAVLGEAAANPRLLGMGTTLAALVLLEHPQPVLVVVNVGDSRVYRFADDELIQVTQDHSLVETLVREGQLNREQAVDHPQRNILVRALGVASPVEVDYWQLPCRAGERFLICSDGLFNEVSDGELAMACARGESPQTIADDLVELANSRGSRDNVTVVLVDVVAGDDEPMHLPAEPYIAVPRLGSDATGIAPTIAAEEDPLQQGLGAPAVEHADPGDDVAPPAPAPLAASTAATAAHEVVAPIDPPPLPHAEEPSSQGQILSSPSPVTSAGELFDDPQVPAMPWEDAPDANEGRGRAVGRTVLFGAAVLVVLGIAAGLLGYYARANYFVDFRDDQVVVLQGRPGGVLWLDPTVEVVTDVGRSDLTPQLELEVEGTQEFGSLDEAVTYANRLLERAGDNTATDGGDPTSEPTATTGPAATATPDG
jgi:PPM family protein phosphatase